MDFISAIKQLLKVVVDNQTYNFSYSTVFCLGVWLDSIISMNFFSVYYGTADCSVVITDFVIASYNYTPSMTRAPYSRIAYVSAARLVRLGNRSVWFHHSLFRRHAPVDCFWHPRRLEWGASKCCKGGEVELWTVLKVQPQNIDKSFILICITLKVGMAVRGWVVRTKLLGKSKS